MKKTVAEFIECNYEKMKLLKRSERGEVWLASSRSGEVVIIKRVELTGLPYDVIKNSAFTLPAKIFYCAEDATDTFVVEEFIQGENLLERLERKDFLSESQARKILLQMCDGLKELHAQKIIHRDIKPSNLILQDDRIRLIDFDAARIFKAGQEADTKLLGTKGYAPPEQFGSGQTDSRSDIYSLGVTMKILLGGHCGGLKKILDKCTEIDPKNRFQSVDELKYALTSSESSHGKIFAAVILVAAAVSIFLWSGTTSERTIIVDDTPKEIHAQKKVSSPAPEAFKFADITLPTNEPTPLELPPTPQIQSSAQVKRQSTFGTLKLPETPETPAPTPIEIPAPEPIQPTPPKVSSGLIKTEFFLNDELFDQFAYIHEHVKISRAAWQQSSVRLRITNDTGRVWPNPTIKFKFGQNRGGDVSDTKTLPALADGASTDFVIPFDYALSAKPETSAVIQIWLNGDKTKLDEHYWCIWFDIID